MSSPFLPLNSAQNNRVKNVVRLGRRRHRDSQRLTVVEGWREAMTALERGIVPTEVFLCPELIGQPELQALKERLDVLPSAEADLFEVTAELFAKMAYRGHSGGILLVVPYQHLDLLQIPLSEPPLLLIVDGVEKPGNLGAILRTADAAGVDGLILTHERGEGTDLHNPNVIRASLGAAFTVPVVETGVDHVLRWLREKGIATVATSPAADVVYTDCQLTGPLALIVGSEAMGLGPVWMRAADHSVFIPMLGSVDSLNLSTASALLVYEALRQRRL